MAKKKKTKKPSRKSVAPAEKANPKHPPEPEGGPFARRQAFLEERTIPLGPKTDEDEPAPGSERRARGRIERATTEEATIPDPNFRKRVISGYRRRQEAEREQQPAAARVRALIEPEVARARTLDEIAEDDLLGPEPDEEEEPGPARRGLGAPPAPPLPPPANN